ncbi:hypothetical protein [Streptacidiphilus sp. PAMC 29251]
MLSTTRRAATALAATAIMTAGLVAGASTASAKSELTIGARSSAVALGGTIRLQASGGSDDFGAAPVLLCVDERSGTGRAAGWHRLRCTSHYRLALDVPAAQRGTVAFRAQLVVRPAAHRWVVDRTSRTVTVRIR